MAEVLSRVGAVKKFFAKDAKDVDLREMMAFWGNCSVAEKNEFSESAARQLPCTLKADEQIAA